MQYKDPPARRYRKGQKIFVEGDKAREAFVVRGGSLEVSIGEGGSCKMLDIITANSDVRGDGADREYAATVSGRRGQA